MNMFCALFFGFCPSIFVQAAVFVQVSCEEKGGYSLGNIKKRKRFMKRCGLVFSLAVLLLAGREKIRL